VAYHPPIFSGLKAITLNNALQASLLTCASKGISVYSPHTSLDSIWGGVNDWLAEGLQDKDENSRITSLGEERCTKEGISEGGDGRLLKFAKPITMSILEARVKRHLKMSQSACSFCSLSRSLTDHLQLRLHMAILINLAHLSCRP
jgi:putative NIF3 family GTP cyclohydrolase 1 type 2